jgi:hypothetical protein
MPRDPQELSGDQNQTPAAADPPEDQGLSDRQLSSIVGGYDLGPDNVQ